MKTLLNQLYHHQTLSEYQAYETIYSIVNDEFTEPQLSSFLTVFNMRSLTLQELSGFRRALLELSLEVDLGTKDAIDIVGTGGDGKDTFNISTLASFVVAGTGNKVIKQGNYGASSVSGSSNMLEKLGYQFSSDTGKLKNELEKAGICFLHAPLFHPALKKVGPTRRSLAVKTFFNSLGPLINPANPKYKLLGTYDLPTARLYHYFLQKTDAEYTVVNALDGYDEISLTSDTKTFTNKGEYLYSPSGLGFKTLRQSEISGGKTIDENTAIFLSVLKGTGTDAQNSVVLANASMGLKTLDHKKSFQDCIEETKESLFGKKALKVMEKLIDLNRGY